MKWRAFAVLVAAALAFAGCGSSPSGGAAVSKITFSTWQSQEPGYKEFWTAAKQKFEADHSGVTVDIQQIAFADYQQTITTRLAANQAADVIQLPSRYFPAFADQKFFASLDSQIAATDIAANWPAAQNLMKWNGEYEGVLVQNYGYVMYYNKTMLDAAGIAVPTTWDQFMAAAKTLTKGGVYGVAMDTKQDPNIVLELSWPATGQGVPYIKDGKYNVTSSDMVKLAGQVRELSKYAPAGISSEQKRQYFVDGKAALMFDGPFVGALIKKAPEATQQAIKVAAMPFPAAPGALSSSLHIPASLTGKAKDLAWDFIKMVSTPEMQDAFVKNVGTPAPRKGAGADQMATNPNRKIVSETTAVAVDVIPSEPKVRLQYATFTDAAGNAVSELLSTDKPVADIMASLQSTLESKLPLK